SDAAIDEINKAVPGLDANQYGRTMFLYAGLPEQHLAVSFRALDELRDGNGNVLVESMSIHDKVHSGSIYIQYLPMLNSADLSIHSGKNYTDDFWHAFFMSNHMNQTPGHFIRGIRGRTLWHNEYRSNKLYQSVKDRHNIGTAFESVLGHVDFPAGFQTGRDPLEDPLAPFHGNTCDSCHVRNGSGIPLMPDGKLPKIHVDRGMRADADYRVKTGDYTYTNRTYPDQEVPTMKMVFFDLDEAFVKNPKQCDDDDHTVPKDIDLVPLVPASDKNFYSNKIMNFYGNSLPLNQNGKRLLYDMKYVDIDITDDDDGFEVVDKTPRGTISRGMYRLKRVDVHNVRIEGADVCWKIRLKPASVPYRSWPDSCDEVSGIRIEQAIEGGEIGFMHLLGRRLGNTPLIEMIPDAAILDAQQEQKESSVPGCISLAPGTRSGMNGEYNYRNCTSGKYRKYGDANDCYIGRWGWIGDRASLEDQIANAAHVEMNISSSESYNQVHPHLDDELELVRYDGTLCGPANASCQELAVNSDITEQEIRDMATYQRWIGIPNRSEYQVSTDKVQQGEAIFNRLQCSSCHVIRKIAFRWADNMLPDEERNHLRKLEIPADNASSDPDYPFVSYLGTDLLMHDMG
ncbi:MAG: di-heme oxidoredictase family protein, partial [Saprospiraceae bacterium]|nr:di-heme oxidoredictase family protein [Saprospiraceae bacterium]